MWLSKHEYKFLIYSFIIYDAYLYVMYIWVTLYLDTLIEVYASIIYDKLLIMYVPLYMYTLLYIITQL